MVSWGAKSSRSLNSRPGQLSLPSASRCLRNLAARCSPAQGSAAQAPPCPADASRQVLMRRDKLVPPRLGVAALTPGEVGGEILGVDLPPGRGEGDLVQRRVRDLDLQLDLVAIDARLNLDGRVERRRAATLPPGLVGLPAVTSSRRFGSHASTRPVPAQSSDRPPQGLTRRRPRGGIPGSAVTRAPARGPADHARGAGVARLAAHVSRSGRYGAAGSPIPGAARPCAPVRTKGHHGSAENTCR